MADPYATQGALQGAISAIQGAQQQVQLRKQQEFRQQQLAQQQAQFEQEFRMRQQQLAFQQQQQMEAERLRIEQQQRVEAERAQRQEYLNRLATVQEGQLALQKAQQQAKATAETAQQQAKAQAQQQAAAARRSLGSIYDPSLAAPPAPTSPAPPPGTSTQIPTAPAPAVSPQATMPPASPTATPQLPPPLPVPPSALSAAAIPAGAPPGAQTPQPTQPQTPAPASASATAFAPTGAVGPTSTPGQAAGAGVFLHGGGVRTHEQMDMMIRRASELRQLAARALTVGDTTLAKEYEDQLESLYDKITTPLASEAQLEAEYEEKKHSAADFRAKSRALFEAGYSEVFGLLDQGLKLQAKERLSEIFEKQGFPPMLDIHERKDGGYDVIIDRSDQMGPKYDRIPYSPRAVQNMINASKVGQRLEEQKNAALDRWAKTRFRQPKEGALDVGAVGGTEPPMGRAQESRERAAMSHALDFVVDLLPGLLNKEEQIGDVVASTLDVIDPSTQAPVWTLGDWDQRIESALLRRFPKLKRPYEEHLKAQGQQPAGATDQPVAAPQQPTTAGALATQASAAAKATKAAAARAEKEAESIVQDILKSMPRDEAAKQAYLQAVAQSTLSADPAIERLVDEKLGQRAAEVERGLSEAYLRQQGVSSAVRSPFGALGMQPQVRATEPKPKAKPTRKPITRRSSQ